jgi:hypothetical protein
MKLSNVTAKLTFVKNNAVRALAVAVLAGGALTVAAPASQAQQFAVGVQFGRPVYVAPLPPARGYFGFRSYDEWRAHQDFVRHEEWMRFHHERAWGYR